MPLPHPTTFSGHIVDIPGRRIYDGTIIVSDGTIAAITPCDGLPADAPYLLPGFIDSHVHIESSMMTPAAFAAVAVRTSRRRGPAWTARYWPRCWHDPTSVFWPR